VASKCDIYYEFNELDSLLIVCICVICLSLTQGPHHRRVAVVHRK